MRGAGGQVFHLTFFLFCIGGAQAGDEECLQEIKGPVYFLQQSSKWVRFVHFIFQPRRVDFSR